MKQALIEWSPYIELRPMKAIIYLTYIDACDKTETQGIYWDATMAVAPKGNI